MIFLRTSSTLHHSENGNRSVRLRQSDFSVHRYTTAHYKDTDTHTRTWERWRRRRRWIFRSFYTYVRLCVYLHIRIHTYIHNCAKKAHMMYDWHIQHKYLCVHVLKMAVNGCFPQIFQFPLYIVTAVDVFPYGGNK